jgi:HlyD family secretion protein
MASMTDNSTSKRQATEFGSGAAGPGPDDWGLRRRLIGGVVAIVLFVATAFGWASVAQLSGAVIAPGTIVVEGHSKKVQHAHGGVVSEIAVTNGSHVAEGDVLIRLDDTQARASLGIVSSQLAELTGRKARLVAERDNATHIAFPDMLRHMPGSESSRII